MGASTLVDGYGIKNATDWVIGDMLQWGCRLSSTDSDQNDLFTALDVTLQRDRDSPRRIALDPVPLPDRDCGSASMGAVDSRQRIRAAGRRGGW